MTTHGSLGLSDTPWVRNAFSPEDRDAVASLIPHSWTVGVSAYRGQPGRFSVWLLDPELVERHRWEGQRDPVRAAREMARMAQALVAEGPEPDPVIDPIYWDSAVDTSGMKRVGPEPESADPITQAHWQADRLGTGWVEGEDGYVRAPLSYEGTK